MIYQSNIDLNPHICETVTRIYILAMKDTGTLGKGCLAEVAHHFPDEQTPIHPT